MTRTGLFWPWNWMEYATLGRGVVGQVIVSRAEKSQPRKCANTSPPATELADGYPGLALILCSWVRSGFLSRVEICGRSLRFAAGRLTRRRLLSSEKTTHAPVIQPMPFAISWRSAINQNDVKGKQRYAGVFRVKEKSTIRKDGF